MPTLLADLINAIPVAGRQDVISPESHNSVRDAIVAIATELGGAVARRSVTLTFAPTFLKVPDPLSPEKFLPEWQINIGSAHNKERPAPKGWLPVQLPDGSRIQELCVLFEVNQRLERKLHVKLQRQITDEKTTELLAELSQELVEPRIYDEKAPFTNDPRVFPTPGREPADIVRNELYKYFVEATVDGVLPAASVMIFAIRVVCRIA